MPIYFLFGLKNGDMGAIFLRVTLTVTHTLTWKWHGIFDRTRNVGVI